MRGCSQDSIHISRKYVFRVSISLERQGICRWRQASAGVLMAAMNGRQNRSRWLSGWRDLARHDEPYADCDLGVLQRLRLELIVVCGAWRGGGFWRAAWISAALLLVAQILIWKYDLHGRLRDILQCLPVLIVSPWVASARRRRLQHLLAQRKTPVASPVTDSDVQKLQSCRSCVAERRSCPRTHTVMPPRHPGGASGDSISYWRSVALACWRRLRCRGSRC